MPPMGLDCCGLVTAVKGNDGEWHPIDLSQPVELVSWDDYLPPNVSEELYHFKDFSNWTFTVQTELKITRNMLKLLYTGRELRRQIRKQEKQRRRRLKEGQHEPR